MRYIIGFLILVACSISCSSAANQPLHKAISARDSKNFDEAIKNFEKHINQRLAQKNLPKWENPYLYYLDIGDIYILKDQPEKALEYYLLADKNQVNSGYVNDRLRYLAEYYFSHDEKLKAIEHLKKYRKRDTLIFGLMLNRMAQQLIAEEPVPSPSTN